MKKAIFYSGLGCVASGLACFVVHVLAGFRGNALLLIGLSLVIAGTVLHVWLMRKREKY